MPTPFSSFPFDADGVDPYAHPVYIGDAKRAPTSQDLYPPGTEWQDNSVSPPVIYQTTGAGNWVQGGVEPATTAAYGSVKLTDNSEPVATKTYADNLAIAGAPVATTGTSGIGKLVSDANAVARIASTGTQAYFVQPSNLTAVMSAPGPIGNTTADTAAFTALSTDGSAALSLACTGASNITCATGDLSLIDTASSIVINAGEAVADAIQLNASNAAGGVDVQAGTGGFDVDTTGAISLDGAAASNLTTSSGDLTLSATTNSIVMTAVENVADSVVINNKGIQVLTTGAAGQDILLQNTGGSVTITATENAAQNIYLHANGGTSETIELRADQGTGAASIALTSDVGGVAITTGLNNSNSIYLHANAGTSETIKIHSDQGTSASSIDIESDAGGILMLAGLNNANAIYLHANAGTSETVKIHADQGTGTASVNVVSDVGGVTINGGKAAATAINISSTDAAGGWTLNSGTGGVTLTNTGVLSLACSGASNITCATGDLSIIDTASSIILNAGEAVADAIQLTTGNAAGGMTASIGTGGWNVTSTGAISLAGAAASTLSTSAGDLNLTASTNSVTVTGAEAVADAIKLNASDAAGGITMSSGTGGLVASTTGAVSLDGQTASHLKVTGAADLTLQSTAGAVNVISGEANADSINVTSAGGMNIVATGAAGKDVILTCTSGSMTLTAGESASDAFNLTASGAASGMTLSAGTAGITLSSGQQVKVTSVAAAASPYTLLGTDYFVSTDTTGGVLTITLPAAPATGRQIVVYDGVGQAAANNVTIDGNGKSIALAGTAAGTKTLSTAYQSAILTYNGTLWCGQKIT